MNKTVNINLAGVFFHIDEDAYLNLNNYLKAIKASLANDSSKEEIIQDIEARIAELFTEKLNNAQQVVNNTLVESIIEIMGQPEDYQVDEDIFEEEYKKEKTKNTPKKLFRDTDNGVFSGVCAGLGHYFSIDVVFVRIILVLLSIFSSGIFVFIYILLWISVPEAKTTAEKLLMKGKPINISNIEKKVREGFEQVSEKVKDVDYEKYGNKINKGFKSTTKGVGNLVSSGIEIIAKLIGAFIIFIAASTLISLLFVLVGVLLFNLSKADWVTYVETANIGVPLWVGSLILFFFIAIPFFFLFTLGLKMLSKRAKSIGRPAKISLAIIWLIALFSLIYLGVRQASEYAFEAKTSKTISLPIIENDTLHVKMKDFIHSTWHSDNNYSIVINQQDEKVIYSKDIRLFTRSTNKKSPYLEIVKSAKGSSFNKAKKTAEKILYTTTFTENTLQLDNFLTTAVENSYRDQEIDLYLYIPENIIVYFDSNTAYFNEYDRQLNDINLRGYEEKYIQILKHDIRCLNCFDKTKIEETEVEKEKTFSKNTTENTTENKNTKWYSDQLQTDTKTTENH